MKLTIVNHGEYAVKALTNKGGTDAATGESNITEQVIEAGATGSIEAGSVHTVTFREFTPLAPQAADPAHGAVGDANGE